MSKTCAFYGCSGVFYGRGYCHKHYLRWWKYSDPHAYRGNPMHGLSKVPEYSVWVGMKSRCYNQKEQSYKNYGARGIKICDRWLNSFAAFYEDIGPRPSNKHSIERVNTNGDYEPSNCCWATKSQQGINQRINSRNTSGYRGVHYVVSVKKWRAQITLNTVKKHLGDYLRKPDAVAARKEAEQKYWAPSETEVVKAA